MIVAAFVAIPVSVFAQENFNADVDATAKAQIVTSIDVTNARALDFGTIAANASAGSVVVAATEAATATSAVYTLSAGTSSSAQFDVTGSANATYTVTIPSSPLTLTPSLGSNTTVITVDPFTSSITNDGVLSSTGAQTFYVGGTLNIPVNAVADSYSNTFSVTVAYN